MNTNINYVSIDIIKPIFYIVCIILAANEFIPWWAVAMFVGHDISFELKMNTQKQ